LENIGLKSKQDISNELEKSRIDKASSAGQKFVVIIKNYINSFDQSIYPNIFCNISTGKGAKITKFLLNVQIMVMSSVKNLFQIVQLIQVDLKNHRQTKNTKLFTRKQNKN